MNLSPGQRAALLDAAREVIRREVVRATLGGASSADPASPSASDTAESGDPALVQPAGCFVSLHTQDTHRLRGCVGRLDATAPLIDAVRISAAHVLADPRFAGSPVLLDELPQLELEVSVISPLCEARHCLDFDPLLHGIYLTINERTGCFLPQVARQTGWSREKLLDRLCTEKMGLPAGHWRDGRGRLQVFRSVTVGPEPFTPAPSMNDLAADRHT